MKKTQIEPQDQLCKYPLRQGRKRHGHHHKHYPKKECKEGQQPFKESEKFSQYQQPSLFMDRFRPPPFGLIHQQMLGKFMGVSRRSRSKNRSRQKKRRKQKHGFHCKEGLQKEPFTKHFRRQQMKKHHHKRHHGIEIPKNLYPLKSQTVVPSQQFAKIQVRPTMRQVITSQQCVVSSQYQQKKLGSNDEYYASTLYTSNRPRSEPDSDASNDIIYQQGNVPNFSAAIEHTFFITYQEQIKIETLKKQIMVCFRYITNQLLGKFLDFKMFVRNILNNLINYGKFTTEERPNVYCLVDNSLNNSAILKDILIKEVICKRKSPKQYTQNASYIHLYENSDIRRKQQEQSQILSQFSSELKSSKTIYKRFLQDISNKIDWLQQACNQISKENRKNTEACENILATEYFTDAIQFIVSKESCSELIQQLIRMGQKKKNQPSTQASIKFNGIVAKIILLTTIKTFMQECFITDISEPYKIKDVNKLKNLYYYSILSKFSKIHSFQEVYIHNESVNLPVSYYFLTKSQNQPQKFEINPKIAYQNEQTQYYIHFFVDLLNMIKKTVEQGISIDLNEQNICIGEMRLKVKLCNKYEPFIIVKKIEELQQINPKMAKMLKKIIENDKIQNKEKYFHSFLFQEETYLKNKMENLKKCKNNLAFADLVMRLILNFVIKNTHLAQSLIQNLSSLYKLDFHMQNIGIQELQHICKDLMLTINQFGRQSKQQGQQMQKIRNDLQREQYQSLKNEKDRFKLIQMIINSKLTIISYTFCNFFYTPQNKYQKKKLNYGLFLSIEQHMTAKTPSLITLQRNLFKQVQINQNNDEFMPQVESQVPLSESSSNGYSLNIDTYFIQLSDLARKLEKINTPEVNTGIHGVYYIYESYLGAQIHCDYVDPQKTFTFEALHHERARLFFYKMCLPRTLDKENCQKENAKIKESQQHKEQFKQKEFTEDDAKNVIKTFLLRTRLAFQQATRLHIKVSLFLLRHLMIENKNNKQNYPNIVPRLNILQAFMDTNLSNKYKPINFVQEYQINLKLKELHLSPKEHNELIQTLFIFSLASKTTQKQFLDNFLIFLQEEKAEILAQQKKDYKKKFVIFMQSKIKNHCSYYIPQRTERQYINILEYQLLYNMGHQQYLQSYPDIHDRRYDIADYFFSREQALSLEDERQDDFSNGQRGNIFFAFRFTSEIMFFLKKIFKTYIKGMQDQSTDEYYEALQMFKQKEEIAMDAMHLNKMRLQLKNMAYLSQRYYQKKSRFRSIQPIISVRSFLRAPNQHYYYIVIIKVQNYILQRRLNSNYYKYFDDAPILNDIIQEKSDYFYSIHPNYRVGFTSDLLNIAFEASNNKIQVLNIDIGTISLVPTEEMDPSELNLYQTRRIDYIKPFNQRYRTIQMYRLRPIFQKISLCRVFWQTLGLQNTNYYMHLYSSDNLAKITTKQTLKKLYIDNHINIYTLPSYHWTRPLSRFNEATNFLAIRHYYDIGNLGFILCLLIFNDYKHYGYGPFKICSFYWQYTSHLPQIVQEEYYNKMMENEKKQPQFKEMAIFQEDILASIKIDKIDPQLLKFLLGLIYPDGRYRLSQYDIKDMMAGSVLDHLRRIKVNNDDYRDRTKIML